MVLEVSPRFMPCGWPRLKETLSFLPQVQPEPASGKVNLFANFWNRFGRPFGRASLSFVKNQALKPWRYLLHRGGSSRHQINLGAASTARPRRRLLAPDRERERRDDTGESFQAPGCHGVGAPNLGWLSIACSGAGPCAAICLPRGKRMSLGVSADGAGTVIARVTPLW